MQPIGALDICIDTRQLALQFGGKDGVLYWASEAAFTDTDIKNNRRSSWGYLMKLPRSIAA